MHYSEINRGQKYYSRVVQAIYPPDSDWAGPGIESPMSLYDNVLYQDFDEAVISSCSAADFIDWYENKE